MKKIIYALILTLVLIFGSSVYCAAGEIGLFIDDTKIELDTPPVIVGDRTLVPIRAIFEKLGAIVSWDEKTNTAIGKKGKTKIVITINEKIAKVNDKEIELDTPAMIINDRTMVPLRFIAESFGAIVEWDDKANAVKIYTMKDFYSDERNYKISANIDWIYNDEEDIDKENISLLISKDYKYYTSMAYVNKEDYSDEFNLDKYMQSIKDYYKEEKDTTIVDLPDLSINNYPAKQFEMVTIVDMLKIKFLMTMVDTNDYYVIISSWSGYSSYKNAKPEFISIANSFMKTEDNGSEKDLDNKADIKDDNTIKSATEIGKKVNAVVYIETMDNKGFYSSGSGFLISNDGKIVTNYHVIDKAMQLKVVLDNGKEYDSNVKILDYSKDKDIAILKIDDKNLPYCILGDSDKIKVGEEIFAIGSPKGLKNTLSTGIISAIREDEIQISAPISNGSSGGALFNKYGKIIGVTYAIIKSGQNLGFAIPINDIKGYKMQKSLTLKEVYKEVYDKELLLEKITYNEYADYLYDYYWLITTDDEAYSIEFDYIDVYEYKEEAVNGYRTLIITYYIDKKNKDILDLALKNGYSKEIKDKFFEYVHQTREYYDNMDTLGYIVYYDKSSEYKEEYKDALISDFNNLTYDSATKMWKIYYPYLKIFDDYSNNGLFIWDKEYKIKQNKSS